MVLVFYGFVNDCIEWCDLFWGELIVVGVNFGNGLEYRMIFVVVNVFEYYCFEGIDDGQNFGVWINCQVVQFIWIVVVIWYFVVLCYYYGGCFLIWYVL